MPRSSEASQPHSSPGICLIRTLPVEIIEGICFPLLFRFPHRPYTADFPSIARLRQTCRQLNNAITPILYHYVFADFVQLGYPSSSAVWPVARDGSRRLLKIFHTLAEYPQLAQHVKVASIRALSSGICVGTFKLGAGDLDDALAILTRGPGTLIREPSKSPTRESLVQKSCDIAQVLINMFPNLLDFTLEVEDEGPAFQIRPDAPLLNLQRLQVTAPLHGGRVSYFDMCWLESLLSKSPNLNSLGLRSPAIIKAVGSPQKKHLSLRSLTKLAVDGGLQSHEVKFLLSCCQSLQVVGLCGYVSPRGNDMFSTHLLHHRDTLESLCLMLRSEDVQPRHWQMPIEPTRLADLGVLKTLVISGNLLKPAGMDEPVHGELLGNILPSSIERLVLRSNELALFETIMAVPENPRLNHLEAIIIATGITKTARGNFATQSYLIHTQEQTLTDSPHTETFAIIERDFPQLGYISQGVCIAFTYDTYMRLNAEDLMDQAYWKEVTTLRQAFDALQVPRVIL